MPAAKWLFVLGFSLFSAQVLLAREDPAITEAKSHFIEGQKLYNLARFEEALQQFGAAYEAKALPDFLYNIAQCHKRLGNHERAAFFFQGYLRGKPNASDREAVEKLIVEEQKLAEEAAAERAKQERQQRELEKARLAEENRAREEAARQQEQARALAQAQADAALRQAAPQPPSVTPFYSTWWFWSVVGGVVVASTSTVAIVAYSGSNNIKYVNPRGSVGVLDRR